MVVPACRTADPVEDLPAGWLVDGPTSTVRAVLQPLAAWTDTPLAGWSADVLNRVAGCPRFVRVGWVDASAPPLVSCLAEWRPPASDDPTPEGALWVAAPESGGVRARGLLWLEGRTVGVRVKWPERPSLPSSAWWWPSGSPVVPTFPPGALLHAAGQLDEVPDVTALAAGAKAEEDLFGLQGSILSRAVLGGGWELGLWPPAAGDGVPRIAARLSVSNDSIARAGAERWVAGLAKRWTFEPRAESVGDHAVQCLIGLRLLPELEPCWSVVRGGVVVGWNRAALLVALSEPASATPSLPLDDHGGAALRLDFEALPAADEALAARLGRGGAPPTKYPLSTVFAQLHRAGSGAELHVQAGLP